MTRNPRLFETQVDESPGGVIFPITDITLRDLAAFVFGHAILAEKLDVDTRELIHRTAFEHADVWLAEREKRGEA